LPIRGRKAPIVTRAEGRSGMFDNDWYDERIGAWELNPGLSIRVTVVERGKTSKATKTP
jgi:hypothetical protein